MELQKRKFIRLKGYDYSSNGAYFVTICTQNRECLFGEIVGDDAHIVPNIILSEIGMVVQRYINSIAGIEKYVIMPNHVHLIIFISRNEDGTMWASSPTTTQSIPQLIKSFKTLVTKQIGYSIWQRSFHDHIIRNEKEYQKIWEYIDTNPQKWEDDMYHTK